MRITKPVILFLTFMILSGIILAGCSKKSNDPYSQRGYKGSGKSEQLTPIAQPNPGSQPAPAQASSPKQPDGSPEVTEENPPAEEEKPVNMSEEESQMPPARDKTTAMKQKELSDNPLIGRWMKIDEKKREYVVEFTKEGRWIRKNPDRGVSEGTFVLKKKNGIILREDEPKEFHENGVITEYTIVEVNGKLMLGIRGFIGAEPKFIKQPDTGTKTSS
jgi:hypothetical protein